MAALAYSVPSACVFPGVSMADAPAVCIQSAGASFSCSPGVAILLRALAKREGVSEQDLIRRLLRDEAATVGLRHLARAALHECGPKGVP